MNSSSWPALIAALSGERVNTPVIWPVRELHRLCDAALQNPGKVPQTRTAKGRRFVGRRMEQDFCEHRKARDWRGDLRAAVHRFGLHCVVSRRHMSASAIVPKIDVAKLLASHRLDDVDSTGTSTNGDCMKRASGLGTSLACVALFAGCAGTPDRRILNDGSSKPV